MPLPKVVRIWVRFTGIDSVPVPKHLYTQPRSAQNLVSSIQPGTLTEILQELDPMPMEWLMLIAAVAEGIALLIAVCVPIAIPLMPPEAMLELALDIMLDCISISPALRVSIPK